VPVPNFQVFMLPLLRLASDGQQHRIAEAVDALADSFRLSLEERNELLPSGRQTRLTNRVAWARAHLKAAGLLENPARGSFRITEIGRAVLADEPHDLAMKDLDQFPGYTDFRVGKPGTELTEPPAAHPGDQTPEEAMEMNHELIRKAVADDLLLRLHEATPEFFEQLVVDLLLAMGYGGSRTEAGRAVGRTGDGGIDGVINEDRLGLDTIYIQAKRWQGTVGRPVVQAFAGSLEGVGAHKGVLITTSSFSTDAHDFVTRIGKRIVLVDGEQLAELMMDHGVGVTSVASYELRRVDEDFFEPAQHSTESALEEESPTEVGP
jgi:restriction system protein